MCRRYTKLGGPFRHTDKCIRLEFIDKVDLFKRLHVGNIHDEFFVDTIEVFDIYLGIVIVSWCLQSDQFHTEIIDKCRRGKRTSCSAADKHTFSLETVTDLFDKRFDPLVFFCDDLFYFLLFSDNLSDTSVPLISITNTDRHYGMRIRDIILFIKRLHELIREHFTDRGRSLCRRDLLDLFKRAVERNIVHFGTKKLEHSLHLFLVSIADCSRRKKIDQAGFFFHLLMLQDILVDRDESSIKTRCADLRLESFAVYRDDQCIRVLGLKIRADRIDIIADNAGCTGSKNKSQLRIISLHSFIHGFTKLFLTTEYNTFLVDVGYDQMWILNITDTAVDLTDAVHIDRHDRAAHAALWRMRNEYRILEGHECGQTIDLLAL